MTQIKNINGITKTTCKCGNWFSHIKNFSNRPVVFCVEIRCTQMFDLRSALVQEADDDDDNWYVIPLCKEHEAATGELTIINRPLILAIEETNCGSAQTIKPNKNNTF